MIPKPQRPITGPDRMEARHGIGLIRYTMENIPKLGFAFELSQMLSSGGLHITAHCVVVLMPKHGSIWSRMDDNTIRAINAVQLRIEADIG